MNEEILLKLRGVLDTIKASENEALALFAILQPGDSNTWDIIVGGDNFDNNEEKLRSILAVIRSKFTRDELLVLSRLVLFNSNDAFVKNLTQAFRVGSGSGEIKLENTKINDVFIKQGYIFFSR